MHNNPRKTALSLMAVLGLFIVATVVTMAVVRHGEIRRGVLASTRINELRAELIETPEAEQKKKIDIIQEIDLELMQEYYGNRLRFEWAAYLLLVSIVGWLLSARWYYSLLPAADCSTLDPRRRAGKTKRLDRERRHGILAVVAIGVALLALICYLGQRYVPKLPPPGWTKPAETATDTETVETPYAGPNAEELARNWPNFRGPGNLGFAPAGDWPTSWSLAAKPTSDTLGHNILWRTELPLRGLSSPIVWGNKLFLTAGELEEQLVICIDRLTGEPLWTRAVEAPPVEGIDKFEPYEDTGLAASTPATDGERVFAMFGNGVLAAFDFEGEQLWVHGLGIPDSMYTFAASLIVHQNILILQLDQGLDATDGKSKIIGYNVVTGEEVWSVPRPVGNSWASPSIVRLESHIELITCAAPWIIAYNPADGKELWRLKGLEGDVAPSPTFANGLIFVSNDNAETLAIRPADDGTTATIIWRANDAMPDTCSPVADSKRLMLVAAGGLLTTWNIADGKMLYEKFLPSSATASPILTPDGIVYLPCEDGATRLIRMGDTYELLGECVLPEPIFATPAFVDSRIFIRGAKHLYCIGKDKPYAERDAAERAQNWPCFRGPDNLGFAPAGDWPTSWSQPAEPTSETLGHNILWKTKLPSRGMSSPITWGQKLFLTAGELNELLVICIDRATGEPLWTRAVEAPPIKGLEEFEPWEETGMAASTPATDGQRVFAMFGSGILVAFDFSGKQLWVHSLGIPDSMYTFSASLIVHQNLLILQLDQGFDAEDAKSKIIAYDVATGKEIWNTPRPVGNSWASPSLVRLPSHIELITCAAPWIIAYNPADGKERWRLEGLDGDVAPSPTIANGLIFITNDNAETFALRPSDDGTSVTVVWTADDAMPDTCSPVADSKRLLLVASGGLLTCWSVADGQMLWEKFLPSGATASPILTPGGTVYLACEDGSTRLIRMADTYELLGECVLREPIFATPAFVDSRIYIRGAEHLFCIGKKKEEK